MKVKLNTNGYVVNFFDDDFLIRNPHLNNELEEVDEILLSYKRPRKENGIFVDVYVPPTPQEIESKQNAEALESETNKYKQRIQDGIEKVAYYSAKLRLAKLSGVINEQSFSVVDSLLEPLRTKILAGQWKDGRIYLESIGSAIMGQQMYDELHSELTSYILESYGE